MHFNALNKYIAGENIVIKGEIACNKQFFPFLTMFYTLYGTYFFHFKCTLKRHMLFVSFWTSLKFSHMEMA